MRESTKEQRIKMAKDGFIPIVKAARILACHVTTLYRWVDDVKNTIEHTRVGERRYVHVRTLADHLRKGMDASSIARPFFALS